MLFVISKLMSAITQPVFWLLIGWLTGLVLLHRKPFLGRGMLWTGLVLFVLLGFESIPNVLLRPLENRYPVPVTEELDRYTGFIVLGGATQHPDSYRAHHQVPLGDAAERMTVPLGLMKSHPHMQLVFSGGEGRLLKTGISEAEMTQVFYEEQGVDSSKLIFEGGSRSTRENAQQVAALLGDRCQQSWLLVTSAWHMPRAMMEFESVGCHVTAFPVDFRTGDTTALTEYSMVNSLLRWQIALHEWLGLWVYQLSR